jgi:hypothetical protein
MGSGGGGGGVIIRFADKADEEEWRIVTFWSRIQIRSRFAASFAFLSHFYTARASVS